MKRLYTLLLLLFIGAGTAWGQVTLAAWEVNGQTSYGTSPLAPTTLNDNLTAIGLTRGSGVVTSGTAASNAWGGTTFNSANSADAITAEKFAFFGITASAGYSVSLSELHVKNIRRSGTGPNIMLVQYKVGSGSYVDITTINPIGATTTASGNAVSAINLSAIEALQDVGSGVSIQFRLVMWGGTTGTWYINNVTGDDVTITGTASEIPGDGPTNPASFTATAASASQINLAFTQNAEVDNVVIAFNTTDTFGEPTGTYVADDPITGGGTVLYVGATSPFNHTGLTQNTQYFYKIWSYNGAAYSSGMTNNATTLKAEPTNSVTGLEVASGLTSIIVKWTDPATGTLPDGILVKVSDVGFSSINDPEDGTAESNDLDLTDGSAIANINHGTGFITFSGLTAGDVYYVKVYPFTNSGSSIDYKTSDIQTAQGTVKNYIRLYRETFPTASTTVFSSYSSTDNSTWSFSGDGDVRTSLTSSGYTDASGGGNAFFTTSPRELIISNINTDGISNFSLRFGMNSSSNIGLVVEASSDGITYNTLDYTVPSTFGWRDVIIADAQIPSASNLRLRFTNNSNSIRLDDLEIYAEGAQVNLTGSAGWRLLSSPVSGSTYADLLGPIWTQGATGADATNGTPNVFWSEGSTTASLAQTNVTDLTVALTPGRGFAVLVYNDDNYTDEGGTTWPKTLSVTGTENAADVTYTPTWTSGTEYAIAGNPFASTIEWDALTTGEGVHDAVWVWNPGTSTYDAYNAGNGLLTGGLIAPFQGFWIQYNSAASGITFPAAAKTTGGTFRGKEVEQSRMVVRLSDDAGSNQAWIAFRDGATFGEDRFDAVKFSPMSGNYIQLYSVVDDKAHDINALPIGLTDALEIPLGYTSTRGGNVTLDLTELNLPEGWMVSIRDNVTNETLPVTADFSYTFESTRAKAAPSSETPQVLAANDPRFTLIVDPLGTTSTKDDGRGTMDEFALHQNYPNPFNPSTQIRFTLQSSDVTRLTVYDLLGREVAVLVNGTMPAGSHSITFDASNLTSGVYIYKLEAGGQVMTKRMTLLK